MPTYPVPLLLCFKDVPKGQYNFQRRSERYKPRFIQINIYAKLPVDYIFMKGLGVTDGDGLKYIFFLELPVSLYRTKSQKKRFEEELNERMIRTFDGINSQK